MPENSSSIVYLNGKFLNQDEALISTEDRGFYFADGVYEVIKYYHGKPFRLDDHLERLKNSLAGVKIHFHQVPELKDLCSQLVLKNGLNEQEAGVYIQITRGTAPRIHRFPGNDVVPTLYVRSFPLPAHRVDIEHGIKVITRDDIRWLRCNVKSIALLPNTMLFQEAVENEAGECLLVRNGFYTEATHSNVMFIKDGTVLTHPDSNLILPGITKMAIRDICSSTGIPLVEKPVAYSDTSTMDECFITGTGSEVMPVIQIDNDIVGNGEPGPVTQRIQNEFYKLL